MIDDLSWELVCSDPSKLAKWTVDLDEMLSSQVENIALRISVKKSGFPVSDDVRC